MISSRRHSFGVVAVVWGGMIFSGTAMAGNHSLSLEAETWRLPPGCHIVEDSLASGGKAVELKGSNKPTGADALEIPLAGIEKTGTYSLHVRLIARDMYDVGRGWRIEVNSGGTLAGWKVIHGYTFKGQAGYRQVEVPFEISQTGQIPVVRMFWVNADSSKPILRLDGLDVVRTKDLPCLRITQVWPNKLRYLVNDDGAVTVSFSNTTSDLLEGHLRVELLGGLNAPKAIGTPPVKLAAGQQGTIHLPFKSGGERFGYEVRVTVVVGGKDVDTAREYFCVSNNPFEVATHATRFSDCEYDRENWRIQSFSAEKCLAAMLDGSWKDLKEQTVWMVRSWLDLTATDRDLADCAVQARKAYTTMWEVYAWSPGGCVNMTPKDPIWACGDDGRWLYSRDQMVRYVAALKKQGIGVVTYIIPYAQGLDAIALEKQRPKWFCNGPGSSPTLVDPATGKDKPIEPLQADRIKKAGEFAEKLKSTAPGDWPKRQLQALKENMVVYYALNWNRPDVLAFVENQVLESVKTFGWDGLRWDCGHLNTGTVYPQLGPWKSHTDYQGKPLCKSPEEMVAQTVAHLRHFKSAIRKAYPDFCFGTNFGWFLETAQYPKMVAELARDGGLILDEPATRYSWPEYKVVTWQKYYQTMADQGEYITSLGGHYNPYGLRPQTPTGPEVVGIYQTIFGLAGHTHPEQLFRSKQFPLGDVAQFAVRFGEFLFDTSLRRVRNPRQWVAVDSSKPVWWQESVLRKQEKGRETWVIHVINPPVSKDIEGNVTNALPVPIGNVTVWCGVPNGRSSVRAWVLSSESWRKGDMPVTQAVPVEVVRKEGRAGVSIPEVLFWKTVVLEFK